jgi:type IV secretory pathway TrbD component
MRSPDKEDIMQAQPPSMLKPALIAGVAFGVAGAIPVINLINCACCALIIGCGFLAAYLQSQQCKTVGVEFGAGAGAQVGLLSGLIYGVVSAILSTLLNAALGIGDWKQTLDQMEELGTMDPEVMEQITRFMDSTGPAVLVLFGLFFALLFGAIFATIGGLIGGAVFKAEGGGQQPPAAQPPPSAEATAPPPVQPGG